MDGAENKAVALRLVVTPQTVRKRRDRFVQSLLDSWQKAPRSGAPRAIDDARVDAVMAKALQGRSGNATHWRTRMMTRESKLSQTTVSRIRRAFGLQPHRQETLELSTGPLTRDIVGLYIDPPLKAMDSVRR